MCVEGEGECVWRGRGSVRGEGGGVCVEREGECVWRGRGKCVWGARGSV